MRSNGICVHVCVSPKRIVQSQTQNSCKIFTLLKVFCGKKTNHKNSLFFSCLTELCLPFVLQLVYSIITNE